MKHRHVVGDKLREIRIRAEIQQKDVALQARVSVCHLSDIENDRTYCGDGLAIRLAEALNVPVEAFTSPGKGERPPPRELARKARLMTAPDDEQDVA